MSSGSSNFAFLATHEDRLARLATLAERYFVDDPAGALVILNDVEVGRTPVTVPFTWYGDYDVRLRLEKNVGTPEKPVIKRYYLHTHKKTETPWFETIGVDLLAELLPVPFVDEQVWAFPVPEVVEPTDEQLIERARQLKESLGEGSELKNRK